MPKYKILKNNTDLANARKKTPQNYIGFKVVFAKSREGILRGGLSYKTGKVVSCLADTDKDSRCSFGINLATLEWARHRYNYSEQGKRAIILACEFSNKDLACVPRRSDGKFRVHRCKVLGVIWTPKIKKLIKA